MTTHPPERYIIHADLDAFYAAVEQRDRPELRGRPALVGGRPDGRGVVAAASYEARRYGVHSAMPMATAVRHCPEAIVISPRFDHYRAVSRQVMAVFRGVSAIIEPLSLDEAYIDISAAAGQRSPVAIAIDLKERVADEVGLTISVGLGTGKCVAKIASDLHKPDGLVVVPPGAEAEFLAPLAVSKLPGVGPKSAARLKEEGIQTIGQLAAMPDAWFVRRFGKRGAAIRDHARGNDQDPVRTTRPTKSISSETTFPQDIGAPDELLAALERLAGSVADALARKDLAGRTITVKIRLADYTTFTRQATLPAATSEDAAIAATAWTLLERELAPERAFRLLGVGVSGFASASAGPDGDAENAPAANPDANPAWVARQETLNL